MRIIALLLVVNILMFQFGYCQVESAPSLGTQFATSRSESSSSLQGSLQNLGAGDLFTGTANIVVPIYDFNKGNIDLGISLTYNTKGVKVDEHSGNYGLHWGLKGGGYITKHIKDIDDDFLGSFKDKAMFDKNYFSYEYAAGILQQGITTPSHYYKDKEYDEYHVTIGSYSFSFILGAGGSIFITPKHDVKIERIGGDFTITDIHGNRYFFSKSVDISYQRFLTYAYTLDVDTTPYPLNTPQPAIFEAEVHFETNNKIWVLEKVEFANSEEVTFDYLNYSSKLFQLRYGSIIPGISGVQNGFTTKRDGSDMPLLHNVYYSDGSRVKLEYTTSRCDVNDMPLLTNVDFFRNGIYLRRLNLHYSYLINGYSTPIMYYNSNVSCNLPSVDSIFSNIVDSQYAKMLYYRIQLDSLVSEYNGGNMLYYAFEYNNNELLPPRLSSQKDYYGYYNGKNIHFPTNLVPNDYSSTGGVLDKNPDLSKMKAGSLRSVTNSLGLITKYSYKTGGLNSASWSTLGGIEIANPDPLFGAKIADSQIVAAKKDNGLLIDSIILIDPTMPSGNHFVKKYSYLGAVEFLPGSRWITYGLNDDRKVYTHQSMTPQATIQGSNIGFSIVNEDTYGADGYMGRSTVMFSNAAGYNNSYEQSAPFFENNYRWNGSHFFQPPYTDKPYLKDYKIGLKIHEKKFDKNNIPLEEVFYGYQFEEDTFKIGGINVLNQNTTYTSVTGFSTPISINSGELTPLFTDSYLIIRGAARLARMKKVTHIGNLVATDSFEYFYDNRGNMVLERTMLEGEDVRYDKQYYYPYDFVGQGNSTLDAKMNQLLSKNILGQIGFSNTKFAYGQVIQRLLVDAEFNDYDFDTLSNIYIKSTNKLIKGSVNWVSSYDDLAKSDFMQCLGGMAIPAKYKTLFENKKVNQYLQVQEAKLIGQNNYISNIYNLATKSAVATCNAPINDFSYFGFEPNVEAHRTSLNPMRIVEPNSSNGQPQAGVRMYKLQANESITITDFNGMKKYVVGCWVNTQGNPPPTLTVQTTNASVNLQKSVNHKFSDWYYYQAEIASDVPSDFIVIQNATSYTVNIDDLVIAPLGATYTIISHDLYGNIETEGGLNGKQIKYVYDGLFRLLYTSDENGNILKKFTYHISN